MERKQTKFKFGKIYFCMLAFLIALLALFYVVCGRDLFYRTAAGNINEFEADNSLGELTSDQVIMEEFESRYDIINSIGIMVSKSNDKETSAIQVELYDKEANDLLVQSEITSDQMDIYKYVYIQLEKPIVDTRGKELRLVLKSKDGKIGSAPTVYSSSKVYINDTYRTLQNDKIVDGTLCASFFGEEKVWTGRFFPAISAGICILISLIYWLSVLLYVNGRKELIFSTFLLAKKYKFLFKQLVRRDFKVRYKRSVLGMFWSFLNPLLTMLVQYIIFSRIFKSNIKNYPVYLLSGVVLFNFFTEGVGQALGAIVWNANLITKVYVPKYIYPITKVVSSSINFVISLIPLLLVILYTGEPITIKYLLIPYVLVCLILFTVGFGLLLSAAMVFFRDVQFLWGILSMLWMYLTPLFYPASIIPDEFMIFLKCNPMWYYVQFMRTIVLDGVSPQPILYLQCLMFSLGSIIIGSFAFKKTQDKFIMYI